MLVTILPFFLAARVYLIDGQWQWASQGSAECTYDVLVNMSLPSFEVESDSRYCSMISSKLSCRVKGSDSLSCRFLEPKILMAIDQMDNNNNNNCQTARDFVATTIGRFVDDQPFEIRFNSRGIENLVVRRGIKRWRLDMIKAIVGQLNVGFEAGETRRRFSTMENSTVDYCDVQVNVMEKGHEDERMEDEENEEDEEGYGNAQQDGENFELYRLNATGFPRKVEGRLVVEKIRQPQKCPRRVVYFFGNRENHRDDDRGIYMNMTSSTSKMIISTSSFSSYTVSEGLMSTSINSRVTRPYQNVTLTLKSIRIVKNSFPVILNPASTSIYTYSHHHRARMNSPKN